MLEKVSFIDVGTNSVHMLTAGINEDGSWVPIHNEKATLRMGKSLYEKGRIDEETLKRLYETIREFVRISQDLGSRDLVAMATSAAREAENRSEVIDVFNRCGIELKIISGKDEARLIRLGVLGTDATEKAVCIDIGGGSTEISIAEGDGLYLDSLNLGAIRMAFGSGIDQNNAVSPKDYLKLKKMVETEASDAATHVCKAGFVKAVGSSGTATAVGEICGALRGDGDGTYVLLDELRSTMNDLCSMTLEERYNLPYLGKKRADIVIGGGVVLETLMEMFGIPRMEISGKGLREGMVVEYINMKNGI